MNKKQKIRLVRILIAAAFMVLFSLLPVSGFVRFALFLIPYLIIGYDILQKAGKGILNRQVFDENFLMAVATVPKLRRRKKQEKHQRADGHPAGLCECGKGRRALPRRS